MNNCSHTCTLTREAISESDSLTTCSIRVEADLVESRSEKFQENEKKMDLRQKFSKEQSFLKIFHLIVVGLNVFFSHI